MYYAQGDYYRGDYYRYAGGILGTIGSLARGVVRGVANAAAATPVGRAITTVIDTMAPSASPVAARPTIAPPATRISASISPGSDNLPTITGQGPGPQLPVPGVGGALARILPGGASGYQGVPPGYHVNRSYMGFLRAQAAGRSIQDPTARHAVVNLVVKNRRMNPLNPRALRRAIGRQRAMVGMMRGALKGSGYTIGRLGLGGKKKSVRRR